MPAHDLLNQVLKAARPGNSRGLRSLMATADPNDIRDEHGATPLMIACFRRNRAAARVLMRHGISVHLVDHSAQSALHYAVNVRSNHGIIADLLARKVDIDSVDNMGRTALVEAVACGGESNVVELLRHGADVNRETADSETALSFAAVYNHLRIMPHLLRAGADLDWRSYTNWTVLTYAVNEGHSKAVGMLLRHGADAGVEADGGETMLDKTVWHNHQQILKRLLDGFRDPAVRERHVRKALRLARRFQNHEMMALLEKALQSR